MLSNTLNRPRKLPIFILFKELRPKEFQTIDLIIQIDYLIFDDIEGLGVSLTSFDLHVQQNFPLFVFQSELLGIFYGFLRFLAGPNCRLNIKYR